MGETLEKYIRERRPDTALRSVLDSLEGEERQLIVLLIEELSPSANALKGLLTPLREVALRDRCSLLSLLQRSDFQRACFAEGQSRKQRLASLRKIIDRLRFPEKTRIEDELEAARRQLVQDLNLALELPAALEGDTLKVTLKARKAADFVDIGSRVTALAEHPSTKKIFSILHGEI